MLLSVSHGENIIISIKMLLSKYCIAFVFAPWCKQNRINGSNVHNFNLCFKCMIQLTKFSNQFFIINCYVEK